MGNSLCKEPRGGSSMRPGRVFDSFGNIMCPNGLGKSKHGINKTYLSRHVLETTSKANTLNNWNNTPEATPDSAKVIDTPPVAPPRKKRNTLERGTSPETMLKVKNGFKDVFGAESRRQSYDIVAKRKPSDTVDKGLPALAASSFAIDVKDEEFTDFSKVPTKAELDTPKEDPIQNGSAKVSRVGNKKSDKFFGENLSDALSGGSVVIERRKSAKKELPDLDKIDQFIEKNVLNMAAKSDVKEVPKIKITVPDAKVDEAKPKPESPKVQTLKDIFNENEQYEKDFMKYVDESVGNSTSLKAEFLMAMLEDYPENRYQGMAPVEEPVIIPRKRKTRHICDNDEHMHNMLHKHDHKVDSSKNLITTEASIETPPRKPDRDFSRYLAPAPSNNDDSDDSCSSRPFRKRASTMQCPPSPPFRHRMPKSPSVTEFRGNLSNTNTSTPKKLDAPVEVKAHSPRTLKRIISMPTSIGMVKTETRTPSPRPVLLKSNSSSSFLVMDLQQAHMKVVPFTPQDPRHNASDDLVKPKSRLAMRKISTKSSDGTPCVSTPTLELPSPKFTIGSREVLNSPPDVEPPPPPVPKRQNYTSADLPLLGYDLGGFLVSSNVIQHHDITAVLNSVDNDKSNGDNILKEFQGYLEDQINSELNNSNPKYPITVQLLEKLDRLSEPQDKLEDISIDLVESDNSNKSSDMDDCFDPEFEKIEKTDVEESRDTDSIPSSSDAESVIEGSDQLGSMVEVKAASARMGRRESIEDVDGWFKNHISTNLADGQIIGLRKRRGSEGYLAYDTTRQYPFGEGRRRHDSHSAEMFEDITKLHDLGSKGDTDTKQQHSTVKGDRMQNRRGSDGLVFYDTSRKFPFGAPNVNLPKAIEQEMANQLKTNNELKEATTTNTSYGQDVEKQKMKEPETSTASSDHSTLLKFLSKENLVE